MLFLASHSPRRRQLLIQLGVNYRAVEVAVDESPLARETPRAYVKRLAYAKARAGSERVGGGATIGADTTVVLHEDMLGKPRNRVDAVRMLCALSGQTHRVLTGVAVIFGERSAYRLSESKVYFRTIEESEAIAYWQTGEPADKAGGYAIQGRGAVFIARIEGSYSGIMGLPLYETAELLNDLGLAAGRMSP